LPATTVAGKSHAAVTDTKTGDELTGLRARSPTDLKDVTENVPGDKKLASTKSKVTRQRIVEVGKLPKSVVSRVKPAGSTGSVSKKINTADDKTEKKPPGRPASGSKAEERFLKKKLLVEEKKSASSGHIDVKRTMNLLVEKVDSQKEDKASTQKRVGIYCVFFD